MTPKNKSVPSVMSDKSDPSVSTLKSLVPPLDLCRKIPADAFEDSVLVWFGVKNHDSTMEVVPRLELGETCKMFLKKGLRILYPAPTLQEIMAELEKRFDDVCVFNAFEKGFWYVQIEDMSIPKSYSGYDRNPATAALKLWLEINSIPSIPSIPTPEAQK